MRCNGMKPFIFNWVLGHNAYVSCNLTNISFESTLPPSLHIFFNSFIICIEFHPHFFIKCLPWFSYFLFSRWTPGVSGDSFPMRMAASCRSELHMPERLTNLLKAYGQRSSSCLCFSVQSATIQFGFLVQDKFATQGWRWMTLIGLRKHWKCRKQSSSSLWFQIRVNLMVVACSRGLRESSSSCREREGAWH